MKKRLYMLLLLLAMLLCGCGGRKAEEAAGNAYRIYYLDSSAMKLSPQEYAAENTEQKALVEELMEQFLQVPKDLDCQKALPDKAGYLGFEIENQVLELHFDAGYDNPAVMDPIREILCRAALAKTFTQIPGISHIRIYVGDQPLMEQDGNPVGLLSDSDFIESISDVNTFERTSLTLYFTDETGRQMAKEEREVVHSINTSMERLVVEELIKGPQSAGRMATIPPETKLLNITVNENVCYVNFDAAFLNVIPGLSEYVPIYSVVNSLCEISDINKVQITVNGSSDVMYRDVISLNTQFERNLEIGKVGTE